MRSIFFLMIFMMGINASIVIKLGSYSNKENVDRELLKLDTGVRESSHIIFEDNLYRAYSKTFATEQEAKDHLAIYQKVFADAYIMHPTHKSKQNTVIVKKDSKVPQSRVDTLKITHSSKVLKPENVEENTNLSFMHLLLGRTLYYAPNKITSKSQKMLIEIAFDENSVVTYKPIIGKFPPLSMRYYIQGKRLYITRTTPNASEFIKLEETFFEYYLLSKYSRGKVISTLRYYTNQDNAKAYLNSFKF